MNSRIFGISLSFVGLLVGAGFATGQEVVQYFTSFGAMGIWGTVIAGAVMTLAGTVFLQLGSYFHASEHNRVFRQVTHPIMSKMLDVAVILTLFAVGFVMLAGAGSNMEQQFGWPTWLGSALMVVLVMVTGMFDVNKVSKVIGAVTPTVIIAVLVVGIYTVLNLPDDPGAVMAVAQENESPINNWLVSALNYNGLALILAVSMSLVIGGDHLSPREAGKGGFIGGIIYSIMMLIAMSALLLNADKIAGSEIPMLTLVNEIHPILGLIMAIVIYMMIFNTAIGMFYALGKRLSAGRESRYRLIFILGCLLGFAVSFAGFKTLMVYVYPVLGYIGIIMVVVLVVGWFKSLSEIKDESIRRARISALLNLKLHPDKEYEEGYDDLIGDELEASNIKSEELYDSVIDEVTTQLDDDSSADFDKDSYEDLGVEAYIDSEKPETPRE